MKKNLISAIFGLIILICLPKYTSGFDDKITHPAITEQAVNDRGKFDLDVYLKSNLGFANGIGTKLPSHSKDRISDLLKQSSADEDDPMCRASNHMHNPLNNVPWNKSAMSDEPLWLDAYCIAWKRYSNITWATGQEMKNGPVKSRAGQEMGWDNARAYYYKALTSKTNLPPPFSPGRDWYFAKTFHVST